MSVKYLELVLGKRQHRRASKVDRKIDLPLVEITYGQETQSVVPTCLRTQWPCNCEDLFARHCRQPKTLSAYLARYIISATIPSIDESIKKAEQKLVTVLDRSSHIHFSENQNPNTKQPWTYP